MLRKDTTASLVAGVAGMMAFFPAFLGPMLVYRLVVGLPLGAQGPWWEILLLLVPVAPASLAFMAVHSLVLVHVFGYDRLAARAAFFESDTLRGAPCSGGVWPWAPAVAPAESDSTDPWAHDAFDDASLAAHRREERDPH